MRLEELLNHIYTGLFLYKYSPFWLYFVSFVVIIGGLIVYFWHSTREYPLASQKVETTDHIVLPHVAEEQGILNPQAPDYVQKRGRDDAAVDEEKASAASASNEKSGEVAVVEQN
jgi:solute carrier family 35 protein F1/2